MIFDLVVLALTVLPLLVGLSLVVKPQTVKDILGGWTRSAAFLREASPAQARIIGIIIALIAAIIALAMLKTVEDNRFFHTVAEHPAFLSQ